MIVYIFHRTGRPPGPEMENAVNRESYSLAAGLALGLVMLEVFATWKKWYFFYLINMSKN